MTFKAVLKSFDKGKEITTMRMKNLLVPTLREVPAEAEITSHKLMLRAAYIRKLAAGIYSYLPLGLKTLKKVEEET